MSKVTTLDKNLGYNEFMQQAKAMRKRPHVQVGFQGSSGNAIHPGKSRATIVEIATFNEFGTRSKNGNVHIPARPFIRSTMDESYRHLLNINSDLFRKVATGKMTTETALKILGLEIKALIQAKITNISDPPNAPYTIAKKGSSNPLIDTGRMRQSVTYVVSTGGVLTERAMEKQVVAQGARTVSRQKSKSVRRTTKNSRVAKKIKRTISSNLKISKSTSKKLKKLQKRFTSKATKSGNRIVSKTSKKFRLLKKRLKGAFK